MIGSSFDAMTTAVASLIAVSATKRVISLVSVLLHVASGLIVRDSLLEIYPSSGQDTKSTLPLLAVYTNTPATVCSIRCTRNKYCGGVNLRKAGPPDLCELVNGKSTAASFLATPGYRYYENNDYDECLSSPCLNGAQCVDGLNKYTCTCHPGFTGTNCAVDIDECVGHMCEHGSLCVDGINSYTCMCLPDYGGDFCEICPIMKMGVNCDQDCKLTVQGTEYYGTAQVTNNGRNCQRWDADLPHPHTYDEDSMFPLGSVANAANYCRNPIHPSKDLESRPWCFTTNIFHRWEFCDIPLCP